MTTTDPSADRPHRTGKHPRARWLTISIVIVAAVVAFDQATKLAVRAQLAVGDTWPAGWELIRISHVRNSGAAFGIMQDATTFLTLVSIVMAVVLGVVIYRMATTQPWYAVCLSLILGGALGNLIERVRLGYVTDFIDPMRYPSFNVADSSIVIGVAAMVLLSLFDRDGEPAGETADESSATRAEYEAGR